MKLLHKALALPLEDKAILTEALCCLVIAELCVMFIPFRWIAPRLGTYMLETLHIDLGSAQSASSLRVRRWVKRTADNLPWQPKCLARSIAAKIMLKSRRIPSTLYFGVSKSECAEVGIDAHAWVRAGRMEITPRGEPDRYSVVALFG